MSSCAGKVVLVTGASAGIGRAAAEALAAEGGATVLDEREHVVGRLELEDVLARARHVAER